VLGRVKDSSSHDSILFPVFCGRKRNQIEFKSERVKWSGKKRISAQNTNNKGSDLT
jgi:hypothetical protein